MKSPKLSVKIQDALFSWNELKAHYDDTYT